MKKQQAPKQGIKQAREIVVGVFSDGEGFEIREQASTREEVANLIREELASLGEDADACINEHGIKFEGDPEMKDYILTLTADQYNRLQLVLERKVTQIRQSIEDGLDDEPENEGLAAEMQDLQMIADCLRSQH